MKILILSLGLMFLSSSAFSSETIECALTFSPETVVEVDLVRNTVKLPYIPHSFSASPNTSLLFNEAGRHIGYKLQWVGTNQGKIEEMLEIDFSLDSEPLEGRYILLGEKSEPIQLTCRE